MLGKGQSFLTDNGYGLVAGDASVPTAAGVVASPGRVITADLALTDYDDGNWHHMFATYDGADFIFYFDGAQVATTIASGITIAVQNDPLHIGDALDEGHWNGKIDEVRISNTVKSADWIATEYNNQNDPSSFFTVGSQKEGDCTGPGGIGQMDGSTALALWLKADCGVENSNNETVGDGDAVGIWRDQSGNSVDATETTNQPDFATNQVQGLPALNYSTANGDRLLSAGVSTSNNYTIFIIAAAGDLSLASGNNPGLVHASPVGQEFSTNVNAKSIGVWLAKATNFLWGRLIETDLTRVSYTAASAMTQDTYYVISNYAVVPLQVSISVVLMLARPRPMTTRFSHGLNLVLVDRPVKVGKVISQKLLYSIATCRTMTVDKSKITYRQNMERKYPDFLALLVQGGWEIQMALQDWRHGMTH